MWCRDCKKEIRPKVAGAASVQCPGCGRIITASVAPRSADAIRQAREILERWQSTDLFDQINATGTLTSLASSPRPTAAAAVPNSMTATAVLPSADSSESTATVPPLLPPEPAAEAPTVRHDSSPVDVSSELIGVLVAGVEEAPGSKLASRPPAQPAHSEQHIQAIQPEPTTAFEASAPDPVIQSTDENEAAGIAAHEPKKSVKTPLRRPPLHRRFQFERPSSAVPSSGASPVDRKLRVDQPASGTEGVVRRDPTTSLPSSVAPETRIVANSPPPGRRVRIDAPESISDIAGTDGQRSRTHGRPRQRMIDEAHGSALRGPHFEVSSPKRSNLTSVTGQFLAYLGVLGLTIGTAIVIYGHFGGYAEYTPTGWLVTTVAQMLLFLGVINLVSGGIEQTNEDVSRRINTLGEQLMRIEQVTSDAIRGPKISPRVYENPELADQEAADRVFAERE